MVTAVSSAPTLILPLSGPLPSLQYTWYPVTVAGGVQETLILFGPTCVALKLVGEPAAVGEKRA